MEDSRLSGRGKIFSYTIVRAAVPGIVPPYVLAQVDLEEGPRVTSQIVGCDPTEGSLEEGQNVEIVAEKIRVESTGSEVLRYKFRPLQK